VQHLDRGMRRLIGIFAGRQIRIRPHGFVGLAGPPRLQRSHGGIQRDDEIGLG
jgi:hypothetical protein